MSAQLRTESPIEDDFIAALDAISAGRVAFVPGATYSGLVKAVWADAGKVCVGTQVQVRNYRCDVLLVAATDVNTTRTVCVECDGKQFHRETWDQVERDRKRDLTLLAMGIKTLRFSGARLRKDAYACAKEALQALGVQWPETTTLAGGLAATLSKAAWHYSRGGKDTE